MASGRPLDEPPLSSFFGYSVQDELPIPPPNPAGNHLLSDNERTDIDKFLTIFMNDNGNDAADNNLSLDPVHSENWNDMPPHFVGSATSFGPSSQAAMPTDFGIANAFFGAPLPPPPPQHQQQHQMFQPQHMFQQNPQQHQQFQQLQQFQQQQQQHLHHQQLDSRSNSTPNLPMHTSPGISSQFLAAVAGTMHAPAEHNQTPSEDLYAANVLLSSSNAPMQRHTNLNYHNGVQLPIDPSQVTQALMMQANNAPQMSQRHASIANAVGAGAGANGMSGIAPHMALRGLQLTSPTLGNLNEGHSFSPASAPTNDHAANRPQLAWGTDQSFQNQQFIPQSARDTSDALMNHQLSVMECLQVNSSANTTRQATPTLESESQGNGNGAHARNDSNASNGAAAANGASVPFNLKTRTTSFVSNDGRAPVVEPTDKMAPPRKKRKSKSAATAKVEEESAIDNGDDVGDDDAANGGSLLKNGKSRKRKGKDVVIDAPPKSSGSSPDRDGLERSASLEGTGSPGGSRWQAAAGPRRRRSALVKAPRENLTEEQKRENHIKSEQKRRTLIKNGFDDLGILVPGLEGGNHSKSTMLVIAANYLEELLEGNKQLRAELGQ